MYVCVLYHLCCNFVITAQWTSWCLGVCIFVWKMLACSLSVCLLVCVFVCVFSPTTVSCSKFTFKVLHLNSVFVARDHQSIKTLILQPWLLSLLMLTTQFAFCLFQTKCCCSCQKHKMHHFKMRHCAAVFSLGKYLNISDIWCLQQQK